MGRLRAELAGDKEAALSALRRETDEELQVSKKPQFSAVTASLGLISRDVALLGYPLYTSTTARNHCNCFSLPKVLQAATPSYCARPFLPMDDC